MCLCPVHIDSKCPIKVHQGVLVPHPPSVSNKGIRSSHPTCLMVRKNTGEERRIYLQDNCGPLRLETHKSLCPVKTLKLPDTFDISSCQLKCGLFHLPCLAA